MVITTAYVTSSLRQEKEGKQPDAILQEIRHFPRSPGCISSFVLLARWYHVTTSSCKGGWKRWCFAFLAFMVEEN